MPNQTIKVSTRQYSYQAEVLKSWGSEWAKKDVVYKFSNGRKFEDSRQGPYKQP